MEKDQQVRVNIASMLVAIFRIHGSCYFDDMYVDVYMDKWEKFYV